MITKLSPIMSMAGRLANRFKFFVSKAHWVLTLVRYILPILARYRNRSNFHGFAATIARHATFIDNALKFFYAFIQLPHFFNSTPRLNNPITNKIKNNHRMFLSSGCGGSTVPVTAGAVTFYTLKPGMVQ